MDLLAIHKSPVQTPQVDQQSGAAGQDVQPGVVAGNAGMVQHQIVRISTAEVYRRTADLEDLRLALGVGYNQSCHFGICGSLEADDVGKLQTQAAVHGHD